MRPFSEYLHAAQADLATKSLHALQEETAMVWCARAVVASAMGLRSDATEYAHEAIEHAALSGNDDVLRTVRGLLRTYNVTV